MNFKQSFSHGSFYSLPEVEKQGLGKVSRLPVSLRIVLESLVRNLDGKRVREQDIRALAAWKRSGPRRSPSSSRESCCRTSPACRWWSTSRRCATR